MFSGHTSATFLLFASLSLAAALPASSPNPGSALQERASKEGVHLVNCSQVYGGKQSEMYYYADDSKAQGTGTFPDSKAYIGDNNGFVTWEGRSVTGTFTDTGVKFTSTINSDASSKSTGTKVGTGYNGSNWNCYKDSNRVISGNGGETCRSIYYCLKP